MSMIYSVVIISDQENPDRIIEANRMLLEAGLDGKFSIVPGSVVLGPKFLGCSVYVAAINAGLVFNTVDANAWIEGKAAPTLRDNDWVINTIATCTIGNIEGKRGWPDMEMLVMTISSNYDENVLVFCGTNVMPIRVESCGADEACDTSESIFGLAE